MSLNWEWNAKCGEAVLEQRHGDKVKQFTLSLYQGNALLIMLYEYTDPEDGIEKYSMTGFFCDETHAKRCLGLEKETHNIYQTDYERITKIRINKKKHTQYKKLVSLFAQAFDQIEIEVYTE